LASYGSEHQILAGNILTLSLKNHQRFIKGPGLIDENPFQIHIILKNKGNLITPQVLNGKVVTGLLQWFERSGHRVHV
jgi:hypothetical protein